MIRLTTIISSAIICVLIPEVVYTTPCFEAPPQCEPPPPPECEPPQPPECEPSPPPPPSECKPSPPPPPPECEPSPSPPPPECEPSPPPPPPECEPSPPPPPPECEPSPPPPPPECEPSPPPPPPECEPSPPPPPPECEPSPPPPPPECEPSPPPSQSPPYCGNEVNINVNVNVDIDVYERTFTECPYVDNESERDVYISWLQKCSQEQIQYVDTIVQYLNVQQALTTEITNFESFKKSIFATYEAFKSQNIYSKEVELSSRTVTFEATKTRIVEAMGCLSEQSALYRSLKHCETDVTLMPIVVGLCRSVVLSQETYISEYSSRSETVAVC